MRSVYLGLQERLGRKVSTRERIVAFIPDYVGYLVNRLKKGDDGKVAYERCKGKMTASPAWSNFNLLRKNRFEFRFCKVVKAKLALSEFSNIFSTNENPLCKISYVKKIK